jgi:excisionase family DNA binding protein
MGSEPAHVPREVGSRGYTPREVAKMLRVSPDRVRAMIQRGELGALNLAQRRSGRPRYVVMPCHLEAFCRSRQAVPEVAPAPRRRRAAGRIDYYPDY